MYNVLFLWPPLLCDVSACNTAPELPCSCLTPLMHLVRGLLKEEEEEEESLFKADAVNEEDSERDRATQV